MGIPSLKKQRTSIQDIAKKCSLSMMTVSRALRGA
ncbi:LacI family DNA-binding transcriptional regulator, partial [Candidatus Sumerlaeota bacterium]|nr:LacI family DNA-binding transcriptional regulator [Candidatus Sumerlaeota bacterium]